MAGLQAYGIVSGLVGGVFKAGLKGLAAIGIGGGALGLTEQATNTDGTGGIPSKIWRSLTQTAAVEASGTQAVDNLFDSVSGVSNSITASLSGGLGTILMFLSHITGSKTLENWANKCFEFEQVSRRTINDRIEAGRKVGAQGSGADLSGMGTGPKNSGADSGMSLQTGASLAALGAGTAAAGASYLLGKRGAKGVTPDVDKAIPSGDKKAGLNPVSGGNGPDGTNGGGSPKANASVVPDADGKASVSHWGLQDVGETTPKAAATAAADAAADAVKATPTVKGKFGVVATGATVVAGSLAAGTYALLGSTDSAQAATMSGAAAPALSPVEGAVIGGAATMTTLEMAKGASMFAREGAEFALKRAPIVGGLVTAFAAASTAGYYAWNGEYGRAGAELGTGIVEAAVNTTGAGLLGGGDAAREMIRGGVEYFAGSKYAPDKSGIRTIAEYATGTGDFSASQKLGPNDFRAAVENSPISVPEAMVEVPVTDALGHVIGSEKVKAATPAPLVLN